MAAIRELDCMNLGAFSLKRERNQSGFKKKKNNQKRN